MRFIENIAGRVVLNPLLIILIAFLVMGLIAAVVVIIVISTNKKNNGNPTPPYTQNNMQNYPRVQQMNPQAPYQQQPPMNPQAPYQQPPMNQPPVMNQQPPVYPQGYRPQNPAGYAPPAPAFIPPEEYPETTVLGGGMVGAAAPAVGAATSAFVLKRVSGDEEIRISKPEFIIGKEKTKVDYCISNNSSISRRHAKLSARSGKCYISDLGSTNCTYINGTKLAPGQEVALLPGDKVVLSNEEFEFIG